MFPLVVYKHFKLNTPTCWTVSNLPIAQKTDWKKASISLSLLPITANWVTSYMFCQTRKLGITLDTLISLSPLNKSWCFLARTTSNPSTSLHCYSHGGPTLGPSSWSSHLHYWVFPDRLFLYNTFKDSATSFWKKKKQHCLLHLGLLINRNSGSIPWLARLYPICLLAQVLCKFCG